MKLSYFDYNLPQNLIAQEPIKPRDHSRLLILNKTPAPSVSSPRAEGEVKIEHKRFYDIIDYLEKGDVLVMNNSKVFPARLIGKRAETGGKVEIFLLRKYDNEPQMHCGGEKWQCLVGGRRRKEGLIVEFGQGLKCRVLKNNEDGTFTAEFNKFGDELTAVVKRIGITPLPPYIKRTEKKKYMADSKNYQTVYADDAKVGSVAAPTAGFHFTPRLMKKLEKKGVQIEYVTLHVGLGTFAPVKADDITKHKMHSEYVEVESEAIKRIAKAKREDRRIIAVGTTSVRVLEAVFKKSTYKRFLSPLRSVRSDKKAVEIRNLKFENYHGWVDIFIYPGYKFKMVDAMITNFHLPKSTLLMLVSALAGRENIVEAYKEAIKEKYRFYSYGDAMFIE